jgi:hypothetical protein
MRLFSVLYEHEKGAEHHIQSLLDGTHYSSSEPSLESSCLRTAVLVLWTIVQKVVPKAFIDATYRETHSAVSENLRKSAFKKAKEIETPVCRICKDSHRMSYGGQLVMCTFCPTPCRDCQSTGRYPYCTKTPCDCECHNRTRY